MIMPKFGSERIFIRTYKLPWKLCGEGVRNEFNRIHVRAAGAANA